MVAVFWQPPLYFLISRRRMGSAGQVLAVQPHNTTGPDREASSFTFLFDIRLQTSQKKRQWGDSKCGDWCLPPFWSMKWKQCLLAMFWELISQRLQDVQTQRPYFITYWLPREEWKLLSRIIQKPSHETRVIPQNVPRSFLWCVGLGFCREVLWSGGLVILCTFWVPQQSFDGSLVGKHYCKISIVMLRYGVRNA